MPFALLTPSFIFFFTPSLIPHSSLPLLRILIQGLDARFDAHCDATIKALNWCASQANPSEQQRAARGLVVGMARALQGATLLTYGTCSAQHQIQQQHQADTASSSLVARLFCATRFPNLAHSQNRGGNSDLFSGGGGGSVPRCHYGTLPVDSASPTDLQAIIERHKPRVIAK